MNTWFIPVVDMKQTDRQRSRKKKFKENEFKHCIKCSQVYRKASFDDSEYRNCKEERYSTDVMPSYGLKKEDCSKCK
jgi:hypothetical protein